MGRASAAKSTIWGRQPATNAMQREPNARWKVSALRRFTGVFAAHSHCHSAHKTNAAPQRIAYSYTDGRWSR